MLCFDRTTTILTCFDIIVSVIGPRRDDVSPDLTAGKR